MTKTPHIHSSADLAKLAALEDLARSSIGAVVIALIRASEPVSREAIIAALGDFAEGRRDKSILADVMAKGAISFMATLPQQG